MFALIHKKEVFNYDNYSNPVYIIYRLVKGESRLSSTVRVTWKLLEHERPPSNLILPGKHRLETMFKVQYAIYRAYDDEAGENKCYSGKEQHHILPWCIAAQSIST